MFTCIKMLGGQYLCVLQASVSSITYIGGILRVQRRESRGHDSPDVVGVWGGE